MLKLAPENHGVDAQHGALFLRLFPHDLSDPARDMQ
jgi:hypothetical protein